MGSRAELLGTTIAWLATAALAAACDRTPEPLPTPTGASADPAGVQAVPPDSAAPPSDGRPAASAVRAGPAGPRPADVAWDVPESWQLVRHPSPLRLATYRVPRDDGPGPDAELTVTRAGGSLEDNIRRWKGQFRLAPERGSRRRQLTVNGALVHVVRLRGVYLGSRKPGTPVTRPKARWAMTVAVVPLAQGAVFFKLLGPEAAVEAAGADFDVLLGSIRPR